METAGEEGPGQTKVEETILKWPLPVRNTKCAAYFEPRLTQLHRGQWSCRIASSESAVKIGRLLARWSLVSYVLNLLLFSGKKVCSRTHIKLYRQVVWRPIRGNA